MHIFIRSKVMEGSQIFNLGHVTLTTPTLGGQFVMHWLAHIMASVGTKYEFSIFSHSKDIKGSQNFENGHVT